MLLNTVDDISVWSESDIKARTYIFVHTVLGHEQGSVHVLKYEGCLKARYC